MNGGRRARETGLLLGALIALGIAIWQFPTPGPGATVAATAGDPVGGSVGGPAAPAQSALDQVLGAGHSVISASVTYGAPSSGQRITYDPKRVAVLSRSQVTAPGYQGSVTDNGVSRTVTDSRTSGQIQRITVAVVVDSGLRPAPKLTTIRRTVTAALGLQPRRGDTITVSRAPIPPSASATAATTTGTARIVSYGPSALGVGVALVLLLMSAVGFARPRGHTV